MPDPFMRRLARAEFLSYKDCMAQATVEEANGGAAGAHAILESQLHTFIRKITTVRISLPGGRSLERSAYTVLVQLRDRGPQRGSELAVALGLDMSTVSRQCCHLADVGYLTKTADPRDGRAHLIALTGSGRRLVDQGRTARRSAMSELLRAWPAADIADLARLIGRFNEDLTRVHDQQTGDAR